MKVIFLGATRFSEEMLDVLLANKISIEAVFSIPQAFELKKRGGVNSLKYQNSNFADIEEIAKRHDIPCYLVSGGDQTLASYRDKIESIKPDVILVLGWYYIVPRSIRSLARLGTFGIHASLLPNYAGGSPLVWAIINGEKKTGITMFRIEDGVDDGDILAQDEIEISHRDTIGSLYAKVTEASKKMLVRELQNLADDKAVFKKQVKELIKPLPIRTEQDGLINWEKSDLEIYNFVRAQTKPYPCAFSYFESEKIKFISVSLVDGGEKYEHYSCGTVIFTSQGWLIKVKSSVIMPEEIEVSGERYLFSEYFINKPINEKTFSNE
ncbi:methionyl-tRNA formyltransferase [Bdellovibrio bacteriovorus]|uniref:methionyl-tRNA formyltransferase n=1 Tax=Bdellovibrio bacteriovorus TaxID=959 RepID=UPI0035A8F401